MAGTVGGGDTRGRRFSVGGKTAAAATIIFQGIEPYRGSKGKGPMLYALDGGQTGNPNWLSPGYYTNVTRIDYSQPTTPQQLIFLRPSNWMPVATAGAVNTTSFTLSADIGKFSTNYNYQNGLAAGGVAGVNKNLGAPGNVADATVAATDYIAVQLADGTWFFDLVSAYSTSTFVVTTTTTIPNVTGGGIPKGAICFYFAAPTTQATATADYVGLKDPATFQPHPRTWTGTTTVDRTFSDPAGDVLFTTVHPGDPAILFSANITTQGFLGAISGYYGLA
jgi:hypothetical protein